jgi:hypothetical protein
VTGLFFTIILTPQPPPPHIPTAAAPTKPLWPLIGFIRGFTKQSIYITVNPPTTAPSCQYAIASLHHTPLIGSICGFITKQSISVNPPTTTIGDKDKNQTTVYDTGPT